MKEVKDSDLRIEWRFSGEHMRVADPNGEVLLSTLTNFTSPRLTDRQVKWLKEHFEAKRKKYVFA